MNASKKTGLSRGAVLLVFFLLFVPIFSYVWPRLLTSWFDPSNPWVSYLYMYGFGFVVFIIGLLITISSKALDISTKRGSFWVKFLIFGFFFYLTLHGVWIYLATTMPYKG